MALKEIDKDFYAQHRSGLTRYCLEVYGRIDNYLIDKELNNMTPPSFEIKRRHKLGQTYYANFQLMAYKSEIRSKLCK